MFFNEHVFNEHVFPKHIFPNTTKTSIFGPLLASLPFLGLLDSALFWAFCLSAFFGLLGLFPFWPFGLHPFLGYTLSAMSGQDWLPTKRCTSRTIPL